MFTLSRFNLFMFWYLNLSSIFLKYNGTYNFILKEFKYVKKSKKFFINYKLVIFGHFGF